MRRSGTSAAGSCRWLTADYWRQPSSESRPYSASGIAASSEAAPQLASRLRHGSRKIIQLALKHRHPDRLQCARQLEALHALPGLRSRGTRVSHEFLERQNVASRGSLLIEHSGYLAQTKTRPAPWAVLFEGSSATRMTCLLR